MNKDNINEFASFDEYLRQGEPSQKESAENWKTAIGLQAVDGLQPSAYLIDVAKRNIEGDPTSTPQAILKYPTSTPQVQSTCGDSYSIL